MIRAVLVVVAVLVGACSQDPEPLPRVEAPGSLAVGGSFDDGDTIPRRFTCDGEDTSPALHWDAVEGAASYAVVVSDVDADDFVHWLVWNIDPDVTRVAEGGLPRSALEGTTSFDDSGYGGPCPPPGDPPHTYLFTVYALEVELSSLDDATTGPELLDALEPSVIASGELRGTYSR